MVEMKRHLFGIMFPQVGCNTFDVLHDFHRILEHMGIDPLEQIRLEMIFRHGVGDFISRIDVAKGNCVVGIECTGQTKMLADLL